jgi:S1-C subfamily serine protease
MKEMVLLISALMLIGFSGPARADSNPQEILKSIVKIRSVIPGEAESAKTLGTEREGNGVVIDADGTILTVGYLVREAEQIEVMVQGGKPVNARLVVYDYRTGFSLLKADRTLGVSPIILGKSSAVQTGDSILVAGHGGNKDILVTRVISRQEFAGYWEYLLDDAIYTLPAVNNFSGMALINSEGKLVGIGSLFTQVLVPSWGLIGCNVAIPIDLLPPILDDLRTAGQSRKEQRPWLGINVEESRGRTIITKVTSGSPAEKAGIKPGDIVLTVSGKEVEGLSDLYRKIWAVGNAGVQVPLGILQGSKIRELKVQSIDRQQRSLPTPTKGINI